MAQTKIDGARQIQALTITNAEIATGAGIELSKLEKIVIPADGSVAFSGDQSMGGNKLTGLGTPTAGTDAVNKDYVDGVATGLDVKDSVRVATTGNITLSGTQTIDGVAVIAGDRVLVKDQTVASTNGIYIVASGAWTRATDADTDEEVTAGMFCFVEEGTANADTGWVLSTNNPITVGTTDLAFTKFSTAGVIVAGNGLTKTGNTLDVGAGNGITVNANDIEINLDGATLEVSASGIKVADAGITETQLATSVAGNGLAGGAGTALSVNVDNTTIEITTDSLNVKDSGIDEDKITSTALGNGLTGGSGVLLSVDLASNGGLEFDTGQLQVKLKSGGGIATGVDGLYLDGGAETIVTREIPSGIMDGSNQDFTLAHTPTVGSEMVFYNGILLNEGASNDYTISGGTITVADAPKSNGKDVILVTYRY